MELIILGIAAVVIIALLTGIGKFSKKNKKTEKNAPKEIINVKCPICNSQLYKGENLISKVYRPMNVPDQLMTISGCPHCFPVCETGIKRTCPVCKHSIPATGSLTARLFNKTVGKKHVHVLGCDHCHKKH